MRIIVEHLLALQKLTITAMPPLPEQQAKIEELRKLVPPPILTHFDRLQAQRRKGATLVRHGVCGECHIRIPVGTLASLVAPNDVYLCDICGCYLLLPVDEIPANVQPPKPRPVVRRVRSNSTVPATAHAEP